DNKRPDGYPTDVRTDPLLHHLPWRLRGFRGHLGSAPIAEWSGIHQRPTISTERLLQLCFDGFPQFSGNAGRVSSITECQKESSGSSYYCLTSPAFNYTLFIPRRLMTLGLSKKLVLKCY